jgi:hypothetical protein
LHKHQSRSPHESVSRSPTAALVFPPKKSSLNHGPGSLWGAGRRARTTGQLPFALRSPASPLLASFVEAGTRVLPDVRPSAQSLLRHSFLREAAPNDALLQWLKSGVQRQ